ncbi:MAG: hypothetical protein KAQ81_11725, partial [Deltaproteobacteria bacterium]|nr:hypothetical protein [Deltaproteobacteria bacterium]
MTKKIFTVLCCVSLCFAVSLIFPFSGRSTLEVDDSLCLGCHTAGDLHGVAEHNNCTSHCHEDIPHGGVITFPVRSSKCVACHPFDDPGECTLIDFHQGMTDCLICHAADCEGGETTTTTATGSPSHIDTCLVCHDVGNPGGGGETIHGDHTDASCSDCHNGARRAGNVEPDNCIACHPLDNPGDCNLVDFHDPDRGGDCHKCHIDCDESTNSHIEECLLCHVVDDLHERSGHSGDCAQCHDGTPQEGNVQTDKCIVCHPLGNTGKCNLE